MVYSVFSSFNYVFSSDEIDSYAIFKFSLDPGAKVGFAMFH